MASLSADGAAAAATYAIAVLNYAAASGDPSPWRDVSSPTCRMCNAFADDITAAGPDPSAPLNVTSASGREVEAGHLYSAELTVTQPASADGKTAAGSFIFHLALSRAEDWKIEAIDVIEP